MSKILVPVYDRVKIEGNNIELASLDQRGLRIVQRIIPDAVTEREVTEKKVKIIDQDAEATKEHSESDNGSDAPRKSKRTNTRSKSKVAVNTIE